MTPPHRPAAVAAVALSTTAALVLGPVPARGAAAPPAPAPVSPVDQGGYAEHDAKKALVRGGAWLAGAPFTVTVRDGHAVLSGRVGAKLGSWNAAYKRVNRLDFSAVHRTGRFRI